MWQTFGQSFTPTFLAVLEIFIVIFLGGILVRRRWITQEQVTALSRATVFIFLPCMIFSNIVENFKPGQFASWWALPLSALWLTGAGLIIGIFLFANALSRKKNLLALIGFQNASYLALPVGKALFPAEFDRFALYDFLFIIGFNLLLWSLGKFLATGSGDESVGWRDFVTPPFLASVLALALTLSGTARFLPSPLVRSSHLLGDAAVPVATFVLGAVLGGIPMRFRSIWGDALKVVLAKLMLLPALTFLVLALTPIGVGDPLLMRFFIIQAAAAPAVGIILQVRSYGGDEEKLGGIMMLAYMACMFTLPAWVAAWNVWGGGR